VLIHDTVGAIDAFVLDVRNLLEGRCEFDEFKTYWKGIAGMGVRRLRAWLGEGDKASSEKEWVNPGRDEWEWLKRSRLDQYRPSHDARKSTIANVLKEIPEILERADRGKWGFESAQETPAETRAEVTVEQLQSWFNKLHSWFERLRETLEQLRDAGRG